MAYEHGTMDATYDEGGIPFTTKVVMLDVYRAKGNVCESLKSCTALRKMYDELHDGKDGKNDDLHPPN